MKFYCLRCRANKTLGENKYKMTRVKNKSGKLGQPCAKANCPTCDTKMCRFVSKSTKSRSPRKTKK